MPESPKKLSAKESVLYGFEILVMIFDIFMALMLFLTHSAFSGFFILLAGFLISPFCEKLFRKVPSPSFQTSAITRVGVQIISSMILFIVAVAVGASEPTPDPVQTTAPPEITTPVVEQTESESEATTTTVIETESTPSTTTTETEQETTTTTTTTATEAETTIVTTTTTIPETEPPTDPPTDPPTEAPTVPPTEAPTQPVVVPEPEPVQPISFSYWINTDSGKFHYSDCRTIKNPDDPHWVVYYGSREDLINQGYDSCGVCEP